MIFKIRDNVFLSGMNESSDLQQLKDSGITALLNVAHEVNDPNNWERSEFRMCKVGMTDNVENPPYLKELAVSTLKNLLLNGEKVLCHCAAGASRSVWVICKTLGDLEGKDPRHILEEIQTINPFATYGPLFN